MMSFNTWLTLAILMIITIGCNEPVKEIFIYNPTSNNYTLDFHDGSPPIEVKGNMPKSIELKYGKITISVNGGPPEVFQLDNDFEYVINPSKSLLFVVDIPYSLHQNNATMKKIKTYLDTSTDIDGDIYIGKVKRYNELIFKKEYDFTFESVPPEIGMNLKEDQIAFGKVLMPLEQLISNQLDFNLMKMGQ